MQHYEVLQRLCLDVPGVPPNDLSLSQDPIRDPVSRLVIRLLLASEL